MAKPGVRSKKGLHHVDGCRINVLMAEHVSDLSERSATTKHLRRDGVSQNVRSTFDACPMEKALHSELHGSRRERSIGCTAAHEHAAASRVRTVPQITDEGITHIAGKREAIRASSFATNDDFAGTP